MLAIADRKDHPKTGNGNTRRAARLIIAATGHLHPRELHAAHGYDIDAAICQGGYAHSTRRNTAAAVIRLLTWLTKHHGSADLTDLISKHPGLRPRNVTASEDEKEALLKAAPPHMHLWLLLCSDLAIRSGTAARLGPSNYDPRTKELRFTTKLGERLTLPVTAEIAMHLNTCDQSDPEPFVRQLHKREITNRSHTLAPRANYAHTLGMAYKRLCLSLGITRKLTPHDFRRTTAVAMYEHTHDARDVQALLGHRTLASTIWYLDHDLAPVKRAHLELIKRPRAAESEERTA